MKFNGVIAVVAIPAALALAPMAHADSPWIAAALSQATGNMGTAYSATKGSAVVVSAAIKNCAENGATDCAVVAQGPGGCVAISDDGKTFYGGYGATRADADAAAMAKIATGKIAKDHCQDDPGVSID
jgi:hypothetical protein